MRELLKDVENQYQPDDRFVEGLSVELRATMETGLVESTSPRGRLPLVLSLVAVFSLVVGVGAAVIISEPESEPAIAEPSLPVASAEMPLAMANACDTFLLEVASLLRPGVGQTIAFPVSPGNTLSAPSIYDMRDRLSQVAELHSLRGEPSPLTEYGLSEAISELGEAALFVQLGELGQARDRLSTTRSLLSDLADEPGLSGCFELGSRSALL